jgi:hypothetical protein
LEDAKIAQLDRDIIGQTVGDFVQSTLHDLENFVLHHAGLVADRYDNVAFRQFCHRQYQYRLACAKWRQN